MNRQQAFTAMQRQSSAASRATNSFTAHDWIANHQTPSPQGWSAGGTGTAVAPRPRRKIAKAVTIQPPNPLEQLARTIESSGLTTAEIAWRSRVDPNAITQFLEGDSEALTPEEVDRIKQAIEVVSEMETKARNIRRATRAARAARARRRQK